MASVPLVTGLVDSMVIEAFYAANRSWLRDVFTFALSQRLGDRVEEKEYCGILTISDWNKQFAYLEPKAGLTVYGFLAILTRMDLFEDIQEYGGHRYRISDKGISFFHAQLAKETR